MAELAGVLLGLFLIYLLAAVAAEVFERASLPVVVGELLVGVAIGPHAAGLIGVPDAGLVGFFGSRPPAQLGLNFVYDVIGQLGLIVLLFYVGLETRFERLAAVLPRASIVAVPGVALTMVLATLFMLALGEDLNAALFVGAALAATSVAITARTLQKLGALTTSEGEILLAAAVLDDVIGLVVLALVSDFAKEGGVDAREIGLVVAQVAVFFLFAVLVARNLAGRYSLHLERLRLDSPALVFALVVMLGMSAAAAEIGLAGVVGAFLAGIILSESKDQFQLGEQTRPIFRFLTPFFFVVTGARVDAGVFQDVHVLLVTAGITAIAVFGKVAGCGVGGIGRGARSMAILGFGMVPRGEIGFAVASIGLSLGVISRDIFAAVVCMSIITALIGPAVLERLYRGEARRRAVG